MCMWRRWPSERREEPWFAVSRVSSPGTNRSSASLATCFHGLAMQLCHRGKGLWRDQGTVGGHGTGVERLRQDFQSDSRRRRSDDGRLQEAAAHPLLPRPGDTIATHKRNPEPLLAVLVRQAAQGFSGPHGHGIVLAKDG